MKSKWMAALLVVSLAVNLMLIGFLVGRATFAGPPPGPAFDPTRAFPIWARTLPEPRREQLRPLIREHFHAMRPQMQQMRRAQRAVNQAMTAEPFDARKLTEALAAMRRTQTGSFQHIDQSFANFVSQLSETERAALANRGHRFRHRGKGAHMDEVQKSGKVRQTGTNESPD